jgi:predicted nuclease with TOPRIM domain
MFGIKVIKESEYNNLKEVAHRHYEAHKKEQAVYEQEKKDCESLRQQLNDKIKEVKKLKAKEDKYLDRINKLLSKLKDKSDVEFEVITEPTMCDLCKHEFKSCKKIVIGDTTVCVVPKIPFPCE